MLTQLMRKTLAAAAIAASVFTSAHAAEPLKIGFVYVGPVGDLGWSYRHDVGRKALEAKFGDKIKTTFVENVPEGADAARVITDLAKSGNQLVFTTSFGFMNPTLKVAKQFPNVKFEHATGYKRADNVATYAARFYEGRYVVGKIVGKMTKSNTIGYIGSFPIPEVVQGINAAYLAARSVNPEVKFKIVWVNSWYDPAKERDAAKVLIDQGADVLLQHTDSPAPMQLAEEHKIWAVGQSADMAKFGPNVQLTAIVDDWDPYYIARVQAMLDGQWKADDTWGGLKSGMVQLAPYNSKLPAEVVALAEETRKGIEAGTLHPFQGPLKDQAGQERIPAGRAATDEEILKMDWYVQGIEGTLPK